MSPRTGDHAYPPQIAALPLQTGSTLVSDWTLLRRGDKVYLKNNGYRTYSGYIDEKTVDSTIIWLSSNGAFGRRMAYHSDTEQVWRVE
ncbi:hypothetical protein IV500_13830 [Paeniglutamicibacter antarcticus]|uniref:Uncharacterized protein n=1 Tax=Arthrobacter terrae TaxID=2935737 RepID=A0A931CT64_9MICC|nr:hypothetical protein [Arthrobacter terrae]MBG0740461.1 hypothetical protein [Arthrobacter terrae]